MMFGALLCGLCVWHTEPVFAQSASSSSEDCITTPPQCSDGSDNDGDGWIDIQDPGCHTDGNPGNPASYDAMDDNETSAAPPTECSDGIDNDGDGKIDYPNDPDCSGPQDTSERDTAAVTLEKTADRQEAQAGDIVTYTLLIQNHLPQAVDGITVDDALLTGSGKILNATGATMDGAFTRWTLGRIESGATRTITYRLRVDPGMHQGEAIVNLARVSGSFGQTTTWIVVRVIEQLPQTGIMGSFIDPPSQMLHPFKATVSAASEASNVMRLAGLIALGCGGASVGILLYLWQSQKA